MIVDCHCHAGRGDGLSGPWDTRAPLSRYLRRADAAGIDRTVLFPVFHSDYRQANAELAQIVREGRGRFIGFAAAHPRRDAGRLARLVGEAVERWGFQGLKVHRHDAPITREVCEVALGYGLPVLYDVFGQPYRTELLAQEYPGLNIIVPHLGSFADDPRVHLQIIDQLRRYPNIYADTSGVRRFDYLRRALRRAGPGKLLFGSDGPFLHPGLELCKIRLLGLEPEEARLVCGGNLLRLLPSPRPWGPDQWPTCEATPACAPVSGELSSTCNTSPPDVRMPLCARSFRKKSPISGL